MPKDASEFTQTIFGYLASGGRTSPSSKYRLGLTASAAGSSINVPASSSPVTATSPASPKTRSSSQNVPAQSLLALMKKTAKVGGSTTRMLSISGASSAPPPEDEANATSPKAKSPLKFRWQVSRLRSQFALANTPLSSASFSNKDNKLAHRCKSITHDGNNDHGHQQQQKGRVRFAKFVAAQERHACIAKRVTPQEAQSRLGVEHEVATALVSAPSSTRILPPSQSESLLDHAIVCFHDAIALNNGLPLTIEALNSVLMQFAVTPAAEELSARLGPFFQPSGEEKKLSSEVFLVLTLEIKRKRAETNNKYLKGLTRKLLRRFLVQSGIVADILHVDVDALFVRLFEMTHRTAATIHFGELYDVLVQLDWLGNRDFQVEATTSILNQQWNAAGDDAKRTMLASLRDIQHRATAGTSAAPHWFLSEFHFVNRALCAIVTDFPGYDHGAAQKDFTLERVSDVGDTPHPTSATISTHVDCWWDPRRMELDDLWLPCILGVSRRSNSLSPSKENQKRNQQLNDGVADSVMHELQHVLLRFSFHISHLFATYASPRFLFSGMSMQDWLHLARELKRTAGANFPDLIKAQEFFYQVYSLPPSRQEHFPSQKEKGQLHGVWISKSQFVVLLVRIALTTYQAAAHAKQLQQRDPLLAREPRLSARLRPSQIIAQFYHDVIVPTAFQPRPRVQEVDFTHKLGCPLQDDGDGQEEEGEGRDTDTKQREKDGGAEEDAATRTSMTLHDPSICGFQLSKTKRNSMNFDEFRAFLTDMELLASNNNSSKFVPFNRSFPPLDLESAQVVFCSVMSPENSDTSQMEVEEFAAALAVYRDPNPFCLWRRKTDRFVLALQRIVQRKELRFD
ncbi:hypothetical protein FI667_g5830, partial [Globisporangium splendens]